MKFTRPKVTPEATFDLTNMIDVVLLLIIFFMLTAQFAKSNQREMDLPRQAGATGAVEGELAGVVGRSGTMALQAEKWLISTRASRDGQDTRHQG